jgi:hypothetical protein
MQAHVFSFLLKIADISKEGESTKYFASTFSHNVVGGTISKLKNQLLKDDE